MELLDRYLQAVKKHLPWQRQDDIIAELRANLEAQLEDKEAELGRPLTQQEAEEWIKQLGSPLQVAARYQRHQYLIGPGLFPTYWYVLKLAFYWVTAIYVVAKTITFAAVGSSPEAYAGIALSLPWIWLTNGAIVTLVFAVIELSGSQFGRKIAQLPPLNPGWSPLDLPPVDANDNENRRWSFAKAMAEVIFGCLFFAWLLLVPHYPYLMFGPGAWYLASLPYKLAHAWWPFYWCIVGINGFELMWKIADLTGGAWQKRRVWRHWAMHSLSLIPLGILLAAPGQQLFLAKTVAANAKSLADANRGLHTALMVAVAVVALQIVWHTGKMVVEAYRKRVAA
ncbi:MAG TPA: hypothetical protein VGG04_19820 [Candidatus Sulfotelmatobacter sp.]|jgi:hypothetical protein